MTDSSTRAARREQAKARQAAYDSLTAEQKLERAASRPGNSARETARLQKAVTR